MEVMGRFGPPAFFFCRGISRRSRSAQRPARAELGLKKDVTVTVSDIKGGGIIHST